MSYLYKYYQYDYLMIIKIIFCDYVIVIAVIIIKKIRDTFIFYKLVLHIFFIFAKNIMI